MDDRRNLFVIIFITFFVMTYVQWMFPSTPATNVAQQTVQTNTGTSTEASTQSTVSTQTISAITPDVNANLAPSLTQINENTQTLVNTGAAIFTINHLGGRVQSVQLKTHTKTVKDSSAYEVVSLQDHVPLPLGITAEGVNDNFTLYQLTPDSSALLDGAQYMVKDAPIKLKFIGELPTGLKVTKSLTFNPGSYKVDISVTTSRPTADNLPIQIWWTHPMTKEDLDKESRSKKLSTFTAEKKLTSEFFAQIKEGTVPSKLASWISICDFYFIEAIINSKAPALTHEVRSADVFSISTEGTNQGGDFAIYVGPKEISTLNKVGYDLERSVDLGIFSFLARPILTLLGILHSLIGNYGLSIILLTLLIKLGFLPLTQTSFKSMKAMQEIQPEVQALRERVTDSNLLNQELMALYKRKGVNPLGGCLPVFIQIPVFLGLYNALLNSIELRHEPFALWINDLSSPERLEIFGVGVPLMIILMGVSMFLQQKTQPSTMDPQQQKIMAFMPVIFTGMFILHPMPSGLVLYWLVNNVISVIQQVYIRGGKNKKITPLIATAYASLGIITIGYILTLIKI